MGGLFKSPKPVVVAPPATTATTTASTTTAEQSAEAAEDAASTARAEARTRASRGIAGTIATSARGLLGARPDFAATRKSLLGE